VNAGPAKPLGPNGRRDTNPEMVRQKDDETKRHVEIALRVKRPHDGQE